MSNIGGSGGPRGLGNGAIYRDPAPTLEPRRVPATVDEFCEKVSGLYNRRPPDSYYQRSIDELAEALQILLNEKGSDIRFKGDSRSVKPALELLIEITLRNHSEPTRIRINDLSYEKDMLKGMREQIKIWQLENPHCRDLLIRFPNLFSEAFPPPFALGKQIEQLKTEKLQEMKAVLREILPKVSHRDARKLIEDQILQYDRIIIARHNKAQAKVKAAEDSQLQEQRQKADYQNKITKSDAKASKAAEKFIQSLLKAEGNSRLPIDKLRQFYLLSQRVMQVGPASYRGFIELYVLSNDLYEASAQWSPQAQKIFDAQEKKLRHSVEKAIHKASTRRLLERFQFQLYDVYVRQQDRKPRVAPKPLGATRSSQASSASTKTNAVSTAKPVTVPKSALPPAQPVLASPSPAPVPAVNTAAVQTFQAAPSIKTTPAAQATPPPEVTPKAQTATPASEPQSHSASAVPSTSSKWLLTGLHGLGTALAALAVYSTSEQYAQARIRQANGRGSNPETYSAGISFAAATGLATVSLYNLIMAVRNTPMPAVQNGLLSKAPRYGIGLFAFILGIAEFGQGSARKNSTPEYGHAEERTRANSTILLGNLVSMGPLVGTILGQSFAQLGRFANRKLEALGASQWLAQAIVSGDDAGVLQRNETIQKDQVDLFNTAIALGHALREQSYFRTWPREVSSGTRQVVSLYRDILWQAQDNRSFSEDDAMALLVLSLVCDESDSSPSFVEVYHVAKNKVGLEFLEKKFNNLMNHGYAGPTWPYVGGTYGLLDIRREDYEEAKALFQKSQTELKFIEKNKQPTVRETNAFPPVPLLINKI